MARHNVLGHNGEDIAAKYLEQHGYAVVDRNWMCGHKDLDIVAVKDSTMVFIEVKTRSCNEWGNPEDFVTDRKIRRIVHSADAYIRYNCIDMDVRFDIISVIFDGEDYKIEHIEEAFYPPVE